MRTVSFKGKVVAVIVLTAITGIYLLQKHISNKIFHDYENKISNFRETNIAFTVADLERKLRNGERIGENNTNLANLLRVRYLVPSEKHRDYRLKDPSKEDFSRGQSPFIAEVLGMKKNGFFVDIGAGDGEGDSVSLYFEKWFGWKGLMIEPDFKKQRALMSKHRKADILRGCVSTDNYAAQRYIQQKNPQINDSDLQRIPGTLLPPVCFPFLTIVNALGVQRIDLLTIDVKDQELEILRAIPFDSVTIDFVTVEHEEAEASPLLTFMSSKGYIALNMLNNRVLNKRDIIFRRKQGT